MSTPYAAEEVDMTQPAGTILKTGTAKIHDEIQKNRGGSYLAKGELDREEYVRYLMMLWHIYTYAFFATPVHQSLSPLLVSSRRVWLQTPTTASSPQHTTLIYSPVPLPSPQTSPPYWESQMTTARGRHTPSTKP